MELPASTEEILALGHINPEFASAYIVAGSSAGGNLAASLAHLARDNNLQLPLTGQFLSVPTIMHHEHVPAKYRSYYLSWEQNKNAFKPDPTSELWASFTHPKGHTGLPKAYFQVCGMDLSRDDGLIYEKVLREEAELETRIDVYQGMPHSWWSMFPGLEISRRRVEDSVEAVGWLLGRKESED